MPDTTRLFVATALVGGKPAGHVSYGRTREECLRRAARCQLSVKIRRERAGTSSELVDRLVAVGKLDPA